MLDPNFVAAIHDEIIRQTGGLVGYGGGGKGGLEAALFRVANHAIYADLVDIFEIAAMYAEAIACGHVFNDGNKRTGLACALTYLAEQGVHLPRMPIYEKVLEELVVRLARRDMPRRAFADSLQFLSKPNTIEFFSRGGGESTAVVAF